MLPEITESFTREEADDDDEHKRLTQQADARLVDLWCIHVEVLATAGGNDTEVVDKSTADLEENFNAVDEKEDDDYEQENSVAAIEDAVQSVLVAEELGGENLWGKIRMISWTFLKKLHKIHLSAKETVWKKIERQESQETFGQKLSLPSYVAEMKSLRSKFIFVIITLISSTFTTNLCPATDNQRRTRHEKRIKRWHQVISPWGLHGFGLSEIGGSQKRGQEHDEVEKLLRGDTTRFEEGGIFESFIFSKAANQQLNERYKCNDIEDRWHSCEFQLTINLRVYCVHVTLLELMFFSTLPAWYVLL